MKRIIALSAAPALFSLAAAYAQSTIPPPQPAPSAPPAHIAVELTHTLGAYTPVYSWFGYDEANYTTMRDGRKLLLELHDLSPVPVTLRAHHLLTSGDATPELKWSSTGVYREDAAGHPVYDFHILDGIFDAYRDAGVRPLVELGFMPEALAADLPSRHEPYQVHYPQSTISGKSNNPPKDYGKWQELARVVTAHLVERYGRDTVKQWYFEIWNEPDIDYWHSTPEDYWKLYDYGVAGVRAALPEALVGGPASTSPGNPRAYAFLQHFLTHVAEGKSAATGTAPPMDFISFHAKGQPTITGGHVTMGINRELTDADRGFSLIAGYPKLRSLPIILSEADPEGCAACSSKVNPANNYRNGTLYPAYTAAAYKRLFTLADKYKVNLLAMLSWSFEFESKDYFEGFRDLSTNGIDKPVLNFFRMAALMSGYRVEATSDSSVPLDEIVKTGVRAHADIDALATADTHHAAVLLWNYQDADIAPTAPNTSTAAPTTVTISGLPPAATHVLLTHYRIDDTHSNAYTLWQAMGSPQHPSPEQYAQLQARAGLEPLASPQWLEPRDGKLTLTVAMPQQSISLVHLSW